MRAGRGGTAGAPGLSLMEVLIAAAVLGVAILGMAGAFPTALRQVSYGGRITKATALAHQMMDDIRSDPWYFLAQYNGRDALGVTTDAPANFPPDSPWACTSTWTWGEQFCGNTKLTRWREDLTRDCPDDACRTRLAASDDGRPLARARGTVSVADDENPAPDGGGPVCSRARPGCAYGTTMLRITVTVSWDEMIGRRQVSLASTVPCLRAGCS